MDARKLAEEIASDASTCFYVRAMDNGRDPEITRNEYVFWLAKLIEQHTEEDRRRLEIVAKVNSIPESDLNLLDITKEQK